MLGLVSLGVIVYGYNHRSPKLFSSCCAELRILLSSSPASASSPPAPTRTSRFLCRHNGRRRANTHPALPRSTMTAGRHHGERQCGGAVSTTAPLEAGLHVDHHRYGRSWEQAFSRERRVTVPHTGQFAPSLLTRPVNHWPGSVSYSFESCSNSSARSRRVRGVSPSSITQYSQPSARSSPSARAARRGVS